MEYGLPKEKEKLLVEMTDLMEQAETLYEADDYELLPEIFSRIAEISRKIGDFETAEHFNQRAKEIRAQLMTRNAPAEPEILIDGRHKPSALKSLPVTRHSTTPTPINQSTSKKMEASFSKKLQRIRALSDLIVTKQTAIHLEHPDLLQRKIDTAISWFLDSSEKDARKFIGFFDPFQIVENMSIEDLESILRKLNRKGRSALKKELILQVYEEIQSNYINSPELKAQFSNPIAYCGYLLYSNPNFEHYFTKFDFISKNEMLNIFTDFCADTQLQAYDLSTNEQFPWDLYLSKKGIINKTGVAILLNGYEVMYSYEKALEKLLMGTDYCNWKFLITTPLGALKIGLNRLLNDIAAIDAWLYVIDPFHGVIYSLVKGRDSSTIEKQKENELKNSLQFPLRPLDTQRKFSKYTFDKKFQDKPKRYAIFGKNSYPTQPVSLELVDNDLLNLQYLLFIHKRKGMRLFSMNWTTESPDTDLISGLISAIDSFGSSFSNSKGLKEIQYGGSTIFFADGNHVKSCLFLKTSPSPRLKELLTFALNYWESRFENEIINFNGNVAPFTKRQSESIHLLNEIFLHEHKIHS